MELIKLLESIVNSPASIDSWYDIRCQDGIYTLDVQVSFKWPEDYRKEINDLNAKSLDELTKKTSELLGEAAYYAEIYGTDEAYEMDAREEAQAFEDRQAEQIYKSGGAKQWQY